MADDTTIPHHSVVIIGGGQSGLAMSYWLGRHGVEHVIFEKRRVGYTWRSERWDSFCLVTPNWQCNLPDFPYQGSEPHGFMPKDDIVAYLEAYAERIAAPVREGVAVSRVSRDEAGRYVVDASDGACTADAVVLAVSGYHTPKIPRLAERLPGSITQLHSSTYRRPDQLPPGDVLVVGTGQSGCQIAEDLHLAGRRVHLVVGSAPRCPRQYRGRDAVDWLADLGQYDLPIDQHPLRERVRQKANHYLTGRDGGRDIDLRVFAAQGMQLYGRLLDYADGRLRFADDLERNLDGADAVYDGICGLIDTHIERHGITAPPGHRSARSWRPEHPATTLDPVAAGIGSVVWSMGFAADWSWVDLPIFTGAGYPAHRRGVTALDGVYVLGLPWLYTWGSGRLAGVGRDAGHIAEQIAARAAGIGAGRGSTAASRAAA